jgi:signal transduction histidine kinase
MANMANEIDLDEKFKNTLVVKNENDENKLFSLDQLTNSLNLTTDRTRYINELYQKSDALKTESDVLAKALQKEKEISKLQSEFVSLVSHEFKTPLAIIKASSDVTKLLIDQGKGDSEQVKSQLKKINDSVMRMSKLIESTLNLSRLESDKLDFKKENFCLEDLIIEVVERHKDMYPKAKFTMDVATNKQFYPGDRGIMDQVFTNIIGNAIKYSKDTPDIKVVCKFADDKFKISITDSGIGMPEEDSKRLFGKFFRASNTTGIPGTGIGLYLIKNLVELHSGKIMAKSKLNVGTTFAMVFPI